METFITVVGIIAAISFGGGIIKLVTHPTNGKLPAYYCKQYDDYHRQYYPPF